jgi:hypothetical protein
MAYTEQSCENRAGLKNMNPIFEELLLPRGAWAERTDSEYSLVNRGLDRLGMVMKYISAGDFIEVMEICSPLPERASKQM